MNLRHALRLALAGGLIVCARGDWRATGPFGGDAAIVRSVPRRGVVIAATQNGLLFRSVNGGASWSQSYFPAQLSGTLHALEVSPRDPGVWYAGVESDNPAVSGVYRTRDDGRSWIQLPGMLRKAVWSLALWQGDPNVIAAGTSSGVFLSRDGGDSWAQASPADDAELRPVVSLAFDPRTSATIYAGTTHLPWRSRDGGAHWESIHSGMIDDSDVFSIAVDPRSPARVFASACSGVYRSENGGASWCRMPTPSGAFRAYLVAVDPRRSDTIFAATSDGLLRSADGGARWQRVSNHVVRSISFDSESPDKIYLASSTGGLMVSRDGGRTLVQFNTGFSNRNFTALAGSSEVLYTSTAFEPGSGGVFRSADLGLRWQRMSTPGGEGAALLLAAAPDEPQVLYAAGTQGVFRSANGAAAWTALGPAPGNAQITALLALPRGTLLAGTTSGLFRLAGNSWNPVAMPGGRLPVELLQRSGGDVLALANSAAAYASRDGGLSWKACGQPAPGVAWYGLAFDSGVSGAALAATSRGLFRSTDLCASWLPASGSLGRETVSGTMFHPDRAGEAFAVQYGKLYFTADGGLSWRRTDDEGRGGGYPSSLLILSEAPRVLFALFPRRGVLSIPLSLNSSSNITGGN